MNNKYDFYAEANRKAWNEAIPKHRTAMDTNWDELLSQDEFIFQKNEEWKELNRISFKNKDIAHLSCNNGIELLSLKKNGAGNCVGFDICDEAIIDAKKRACKFNIECDFVRTNVLQISKEYYCQFDLVYITVGALVWIPDLKAYFKKAAELLKTGGQLFIHEHHPFGDVFPYDGENEELDRIKYPYFSDKICKETEGIDYYGGTIYESSPSYEFSYTISDLINFLLQNGLRISVFKEYTRDIARGHQQLEKLDKKIPLSYILIAEKFDNAKYE